MRWKLREGDELPNYESNPSLYTIELHHGGDFEWDFQCLYLNGLVSYIDYCDPDELSFLGIIAMASSLGYLNVCKLYYKPTGRAIAESLNRIRFDSDVRKLQHIVDDNKVVEVYCVADSSELGDDELTSDEEVISDHDLNNEVDLDMDFGTDDDIGKDDDTLIDIDIGVDTNGPSGSTGHDTIKPVKQKIKKKVEKHKTKTPSDVADDKFLDGGYISSHSSDFESVCESDGDGDGDVKTEKFPHFTKSDLKRTIKFQLGMMFPCGDLYREAVHEYGIQQGKNVYFSVNSTGKMYVYCEGKCPFMMYCAKMRDEETVQIRTFIEQHTCSRVNVNRNCKPKYLARKFLEDIRDNPKWNVKAFHVHISKKTQCKISLASAYVAFKLAKKTMEGTSTDQYLLLWDYIEELRRTNPGSTFLMKVKNGAEFSVFRGLYICWGALKRGFIEGCRPVIGVDGCHLSGPHKGILLTAVAIDPNNCMYPFAYAIVSQEKKSTWRWFLRLIAKDLEIEMPNEYTFISDKQKGLILAMEEVLPGVEHRFCVRHLYNNFKMHHKGLALKLLFWKCARASTVRQFERALEELRVYDEAAHTWLADKPGENWSRSHFSLNCKSDILLNNLCESFNACIRDARSKPIFSMLEDIRIYLMELVGKKKMVMTARTHVHICPKIQMKLEELKLRSHEFLPRHNGSWEYEVVGMSGTMYEVSIPQRTCACRVWQLTGIPCVHAISALNQKGDEVEDYVHNCYNRETYLRCYSNVLKPINGQELWAKTGKSKVIPPPMIVQPGRPKKLRRRGNDEPIPPPTKLRRFGLVMKCKVCGKPGHNSRTGGKQPKVRARGNGIRKPRQKKGTQLVDEQSSDSDFWDQVTQLADQTGASEPTVETVPENGQSDPRDETVPENGQSDPRDELEEMLTNLKEDGFQENDVLDDNEEMQVDENIWSEIATQPIIGQNMEGNEGQASRVVSSQPLGDVVRGQIRGKLPVRRSQRIAESPKKGPIVVDFMDLTSNTSGALHCGLREKPRARFQKGRINKNGKLYITLNALKAEMEFMRNNGSSG